jgi:hypothetical protein
MPEDQQGVSPPDAAAGELLESSEEPAGDWLPPAAAALRLGVSERTLWRMVKDGRYHKRTERGRAEVLVPLPDNSATAPEASLLAVRQAPDTSLSLAILDELRRQREEDTGTIVRQAEEIGRLRSEVEAERRQADSDRQRLTAERDAAARELEVLRSRPWWRWVFGS